MSEPRTGEQFRLESVSCWNDAFFTRFVKLRNRVYRDEPYALKETLDDFSRLLSPSSPAAADYEWKAWIARDKSGEDVGRVLVSRQTQVDVAASFAACGFFEVTKCDAKLARELFDAAAAWARDMGFSEMRGPVQLNFFNSYRLKLPGGRRPFYGEPICPDYYPDLYLAGGFTEFARWDTVQFLRDDTIKTSQEIRERFHGKKPPTEFTIRNARVSRWKDELKVVHELFTKSYAGMPNFMPIRFEEFELLYGSFKYLLHKDLVFFIEHKGRPVAFMIAFFDPLEILLAHDRAPRWIPGPLMKLITLWRLRRNRKRIMVMYVGKVDPPEGEVKGVTGVLVERLGQATAKFPETYPLVCYLATDSPTYASLPKNRRTYSSYALYQRKVLS